MPNEQRSVQVTVDIAAVSDTVWNALTDPTELVRWFPRQAAVTPGEGGSMTWSWDDKWTWSSRIDLWEPGRHLRLVQHSQRPFDAEGSLLDEHETDGARLVMDFTLETVAGRTRLRLVHSGFGYGASWDDEVDGVTSGWNHELRGLVLYLERHRGKQRHAASAGLTWSGSQEETWGRLRTEGRYRLSPEFLRTGEPYVLEVSTGDRFDGIVQHYAADRDFSGTVRALDDGIVRIGTHRAAGRTGLHVWIATYDQRYAGTVSAIAARIQRLLDSAFGETA